MDDLTEEELLAMPLHSWHVEHQYTVFRVPSGWIYDNGPNSSVSGATFVPEPERSTTKQQDNDTLLDSMHEAWGIKGGDHSIQWREIEAFILSRKHEGTTDE